MPLSALVSLALVSLALASLALASVKAKAHTAGPDAPGLQQSDDSPAPKCLYCHIADLRLTARFGKHSLSKLHVRTSAQNYGL